MHSIRGKDAVIGLKARSPAPVMSSSYVDG